MLKQILLHTLFLVLACIAVYLTTWKLIEIRVHSDLNALTCGWPLKFIMNDQSWRDPPLPWKMGCLSSIWGDPIKFYWQEFIIDITLFYAFITLLWSVGSVVKKKVVGEHSLWKGKHTMDA